MANVAAVHVVEFRGDDKTGTAVKSVASNLRVVDNAAKEIERQFKTMAGAVAWFFSVRELGRFAIDMHKVITELNDLVDVTGSSVEALDHLANVAKISGMPFDQLSTIMGKFSANLNGTTEDSSRAAKALQFLGVSSRDPATALEEVAKKLQRYADGAGKAALATDIFGKQGPQMLSYLKDLAEQSERLTSVNKEQAEAIDRLDKEWGRLGVTVTNTAKSLLGQAAEAINRYIDGFRAAREAGLGIFDADIVASSATNQKELNAHIEATQKEIAELQGYIRDVRPWQVWIGATGRWNESLDESRRKLAALQSAMAAFASPASMDKFDRFLRGLQGAPVGTFEQLPSRSGTGGAKKVVDEMARINQQLEAELAKSAKFWEDYARTQERISAINLKSVETLDKQTEALADQLAGLRQEGEEMGLTKAQVDALTLSRLDAVIATRQEALASAQNIDALSKEALALEDQVRLLKEIRQQTASNQVKAAGIEETKAAMQAAEDAQKAFGEMFRSIDELAQETFASMFEGGRDVFTRLTDTLKSTLLATLYQLTVRPFIIRLVASATGAAVPASGMASGLLGGGGGGFDIGSILNLGGGGGGMLGGLTSLFGGIGSAGMMGPIIPTFGTAFLGGLTSPLATMGGLFSGGTAAFGGMMGGIGAALGSVVPIIGIGLAIASALGAFDKSIPKIGGSGGIGVDLGRGETWHEGQRMFTPDQEDASVQKVVDAVGKGYMDVARSLGLSSGSAQLYLGFDSHEEHGNRVSALARVNGEEIYSNLDMGVGDGEGAIQAALQLESKRVLLAALQASDMPAYLANVFDDLDVKVATEAEIDNLIQTAQALKLAVTAVQGLDASFAALSPENITALLESFGGLEQFGQSMAYIAENFTTADQKLAKATESLTRSFDDLGIAIPDTHQAFTDLLASFDLTSEEGRNLYASVSALAPLFVTVYGTADEAAAALAELTDQTDEFADAADAAAEMLAQAIERTVELVQTQAQTIMGGIEEVVNASSGDFGEKLGLRIQLQQEQIRKLYAQYAQTGLQTVLDMAKQLDRANGLNVAQLARFTVLAAQYDAERAEELVKLEEWYRAQQFALTGNVEALAALRDVFDEKWKAIIDGVAGGVGGTLSELERLRLGLREWLDKLMFSDLSTLPIPEQFKQAQEQFRELVELAQGGDLEAFAKLQAGAEQYLKLGRDMFASGSGYQDIFAEVLAALGPLAAAPQTGGVDPLGPLMDALPTGSKMASSADFDALIDYLRERDDRRERRERGRFEEKAAADHQNARAFGQKVGWDAR